MEFLYFHTTVHFSTWLNPLCAKVHISKFQILIDTEGNIGFLLHLCLPSAESIITKLALITMFLHTFYLCRGLDHTYKRLFIHISLNFIKNGTHGMSFVYFVLFKNVQCSSSVGTMWIYLMPVAAMSWLRSLAHGSHWTRILGLRYLGETRQLSQMWTPWFASWGQTLCIYTVWWWRFFVFRSMQFRLWEICISL